MRKILLLPLAAAIVLAGCSWGIKLTDGGRLVRTDWTGDMAGCQTLGKVTATVANSVGPIERNPIKVRDELEVMARNEAAKITGADTVHPLIEPVAGSQRWGVYRCGPGPAPAATAAATAAPDAKTYPIDGTH